ncbi:hypothetical protein SAMN05443377_11842 [Propionibacterium cyclohexanicum]|uniref:Uncharacterized protein n=1 Tax=Propionibacterium cyclohexanicum TaxID=64702 RepID=A0A1H9T480_9ACTN|nr:hypothetical protein [Propionibacterium cyclohexanicum]SER91867.1 hypothetical protein SAMN05443377_11842 [Propionibacterium cyclohexanicum]
MKIPAPLARLLKDLTVAYGAKVAAELVARLTSPDNTEQAHHLFDRLSEAARARTPEGRIRATLGVLRAQLAMVEVGGEDDRVVVESWRRRVHALDATLDLVSTGYHGRERSRQLARLRIHADALLHEFLDRQRNIVEGGREGRLPPA